MSKYQLEVLKFILKKGCKQLVDDFYNYQAVFLFLPSFYTDHHKVAVLPQYKETEAWNYSEVHTGAEDTRQLQPTSFVMELPPFEQLTLRLNLVQHLKDSFDQWGALQHHLGAQTRTHNTSAYLHSIQLVEMVFPVTLLEQPTTLFVQNEWLELEFQIIKKNA